MDNYYKKINDYYEDIACLLLNRTNHFKEEQIIARRNNLDSNGIDLELRRKDEKPFYIDVQYSFNFKKYGDIRLDIISAGRKKDNILSRHNIQQNIINSNETNIIQELENFFIINKKGKYAWYFIFFS